MQNQISHFSRRLRAPVTFLALVLSPAIFGCAMDAQGLDDESVGSVSEALVGTDEFLYFRCNATGWGVDEVSRLQSTSDPYTFRLTYKVNEPWMMSTGDSCQLTLTNQKNGWGTTQSQYGLRAGFSPLVAPNNAPLALNGGNIAVRYPKAGFYTAKVNFRSGTIDIAAADPAEAAEENANRYYSYLKERFNWSGIDGLGKKAGISINQGLPNNAQWDGHTALMIGVADGVVTDSFAYSRDMLAHELTHAVITNTTQLRPDGEAGVINESVSDVVAAFSTANGEVVDWRAAEAVWTPAIAGDALRRLDDPHQGYNRETLAACQFNPNTPFLCGQTSHLREYINSGLGREHLNNGIPSRAAYLITQGGTNEGIQVRGIGVRKAEQIYFKTLTQYLTERTTLPDLRYYLGQACQELTGQYGITATDCSSIGSAFTSVGIAAPVLNGLSGITGKITKAGAPTVAQVVLRINSTNTVAWSSYELLTTTSNASGVYRFSYEAIEAAVAALRPVPEVVFQVRYRNANSADLTRVGSWESEWFERVSYSSGRTVPTFEIGGMPSVSVVGIPSALPMTFNWTPRTTAREYFQWEGKSANAFTTPFGEVSSQIHITPTLAVSNNSFVVTSAELPFSDLKSWAVNVRTYAGVGKTNLYVLP